MLRPYNCSISELCGLGAFAGGDPKLTGARRAPYETLDAFVVRRNLSPCQRLIANARAKH